MRHFPSIVSLVLVAASVHLRLDAQSLYWLESTTGQVRYGGQNGSGSPQLLASGLNGAFAIAAYNDTVYWSEPVGQTIRRVPLSGAGSLLVLGNGADSLVSPRGLAIDGSAEKIYWSDNGRLKIQRANLNGSGRENLVTTGLVSPGHIALDNLHGKMYWVDNGLGAKKISRANLDGTSVEDVVTGLSQAWGLALDIPNSRVYWIDSGVDKIQWADLSGTIPATPDDLITGLTHNLRGMTSDVIADALYWTDMTDGNIKRSGLDGSSVTPLFSGLSGLQGIALIWDSALPVTLTSLAFSVDQRDVTLRWRTESETDNAGWEVERRAIANFELSNAKWEKPTYDNSQWMTVGYVDGAGTSTSSKEYEFSDDISQLAIRHSQSRIAYRLKQLDRSGSFSYSHEVEVEVGLAPREFALSQNYPNPFNPSTNIAFTIAEEGRTTLKVYSLLGQEVVTLFNAVSQPGVQYHVAFDASHLAAGTYVARLESGGMQLVRKLLLTK